MQEPNDEMIERLRASKQAAMAQAYSNGQNYGREWAEKKGSSGFFVAAGGMKGAWRVGCVGVRLRL